MPDRRKSDRPRQVKDRRLQSQQVPIRYVIERCPQAAVIIVFESDETERLQHARRRLAHGRENLGHAVYRTRLSLKCNFYKLTLRQLNRHFQYSPPYRNPFKFYFSVPP